MYDENPTPHIPSNHDSSTHSPTQDLVDDDSSTQNLDQGAPPARRPSYLAFALAVVVGLGIGGAGAAAGTAALSANGSGTSQRSAQAPEVTAPARGDDATAVNPYERRQRERWGTADQTSHNATQATEAQSKGVVLISTTTAGGEGAGTGMVLTSDGSVLTNYHVVEGSTQVTVTLADTGRTYTATVVGSAPSQDVALLQLEGASGLATVKTDDDAVNPGDSVFAVGNAGGTQQLSSSAGRVTALEQSITASDEGGSNARRLTGLIQTDAKVVPGDSGGPLYDAEGEVMGINTAASVGGAPEGYAVPIADALYVVKQVESGQSTATVRVGANAFLGVELSTSPGAGAQVGDVVTDGAAARAGIRAGDTITRVGSVAVTTAQDLREALAGHDPGDRVSVTWTDASGQTQSASLALGSSPVN